MFKNGYYCFEGWVNVFGIIEIYRDFFIDEVLYRGRVENVRVMGNNGQVYIRFQVVQLDLDRVFIVVVEWDGDI